MPTDPRATWSSEVFDEYATLAAAEAGVLPAAPTRMVWCGTAGTLKVRRLDGTDVTITITAGRELLIVADKIYQTGSSGCVPIQVFR